MSAPVVCLLLLPIVTGDWARVPLPVDPLAGDLTHVSQPYKPHSFNIVQKPDYPPNEMWGSKIPSQGTKPLNTGGSYALQLQHHAFPEIGRDPNHQGAVGRPGMLSWSGSIPPPRPQMISMAMVNTGPMLGMMRKLLNGKFHIVADAVHVDAIPMAGRPVRPYFGGVVMKPAITPVMVSATLNNPHPVEQIPETSRPEPANSNSGPKQVPLDLLLQEFKELEEKYNNLKPEEHEVTFASLYQNYMKLLEKQPIKTTSTTPSKTTAVTDEVTAPPTTKAPPTTQVTETTRATTPEPSTAVPTTVKLSSLIETAQTEATGDKPIMWLPGMGPDVSR